MPPKTEPRPSPIHGTGLFAKQSFQPGDFIGQYLARRTDRETIYTLWVDFDGEQRGYEGYGRLRYLNHSSSPNAEFDERNLIALRHIEVGEEITFDYGEEWDDIP